MSFRFLLSGSLALGLAFATTESDAAVDADIMFVIDQSGSMGGEFNFLGGAIGGFLSALQGDSRIGTARAGLITYEDSNNITLQSGLTDDATALETSFNGVATFGGTEDAYAAIDAALPGGNTNLAINYAANAVKSLVLITDEDADDAFSYSNSFGTGESAIGDLLDSTGFLNNIIYRKGTSDDDDFDGIARPSTGLFSIADFRSDRQSFFDEFTRTKIQEITTSDVPLPAGLPLMLLGIGGLGLYRRHRRHADA
jgi:hypothetical protein